MPALEEYIEEIKPIFESRNLTNMGPVYKRLQHQLIDYLGVPYLSMFVNGHMALEMVIQAMGLNIPGGEVITTPYTFVSTTHSITRNGLTPVFCDIRESDMTMDPDKIEELITDKTVAIMPVHVYGHICDVERIDAIAKKHNLKVIYDAAHAFGVTYKGIGIGNYGDASMFSFHATKVFNAIEGGAISFKDPAYREKLHELKNFGIHSPEDVTDIGGNAKMDEFRAAMGICNLRHIDEAIASRKVAFDRYMQRLSGVEGIYIPGQQQDVVWNYSYMPVIFDEKRFGKSRDEVFEQLKQQDIIARKYFYPAINDMACYQYLNAQKGTPVAHEMSLRVLALPIYEGLEIEVVDRICDIILKYEEIIMKKILLLGGSAQQVIAIETAKRLGYYTVLCDFLPDNPGQYVADKFYLASTTDKDAILKVAQEEKIDGILAYASDPAAPTAAYVAEKLGLPGSPYASVEILCNKDAYRAFLAEHGFCTPKAKGYTNVAEAISDIEAGYFKLPVIVKPVDSSGSKGVGRIDSAGEAEEKLNYALSFSRGKRLIIEEYVEMYGYQVAGDGLSIDGKLVFRYFANDHFNPKCVNPFVPISASFPYNMPEFVHDKVHDTIQKLLTALNMGTSTYNFDIRVDKDYNVYLMEVAPRDGGNYIPNVIKYAIGVDLVECSVKGAMGDPIVLPEEITPNGFWSYFAVHSLKHGVLEEVKFRDDVKEKIIENHLIKNPGDTIEPFTGANTTLGCLVMRFDSMEEMLDMMDHSENWVEVKLQ